MKIILLPLILILLTGCTVLPVKQQFPKAPDVLMENCGPLLIIEKEEITLSEFTTVIVKNYGKYHECASLVKAWQDWYTEQKNNFDQAGK
jgi:hypothetical protein